MDLILSQEERRQRFIIKNLMYYMGLDKAEYKRRFGESPDDIPLFRQLAVTAMDRKYRWPHLSYFRRNGIL